jgi:hypothetical protein
LVLSQAVTVTKPFRVAAVSSLDLTQTLRVSMVLVSASSTMVLSVSCRQPSIYLVSASSTIAATQTATVTNFHAQASSTLDLISIGEHGSKYRDIEQYLILSDSASTEHVRTVQNTLYLTDSAVNGQVRIIIEDQLTLDQIARNVSINIRALDSDIELTQEARSSIYWAQVETVLDLSQSEHVIKPIYVSGDSELTEDADGSEDDASIEFDQETLEIIQLTRGLRQEAVCIAYPTRHLSNVVSFATWANGYVLRTDAIAAAATDTLSLTDKAIISLVLEASNTLILTDIATGDQSRDAIPSVLDMLVEASYVVDWGARAVTSALVMSQSLAYTIGIDSELLNSYAPFVGAGTVGAPPSSYWAPSSLPGVQLRYPASGEATDIFAVRKPNFGNVHRLTMDRINRETRGGNLRIFADPKWPKTETLLLTFSTLTSTEAQELLTFMEDHLGEDILLIDWEDRPWRGVLVANNPVVQDTRDTFTASFEFERVFAVSPIVSSALSMVSESVGVI